MLLQTLSFRKLPEFFFFCLPLRVFFQPFFSHAPPHVFLLCWNAFTVHFLLIRCHCLLHSRRTGTHVNRLNSVSSSGPPLLAFYQGPCYSTGDTVITFTRLIVQCHTWCFSFVDEFKTEKNFLWDTIPLAGMKLFLRIFCLRVSTYFFKRNKNVKDILAKAREYFL